MYLEPQISSSIKKGSIEVICGSMFSGKTEELIRRLNRAQFANLNVQIYKPIIDTRYDKNKVVSHNKKSIPAKSVKQSSDILGLVKNTDVIGIDEAQFFTDNLVLTANTLANLKIRVIIAGLDMDFLGNPFGEMPNLLSIADHITKVHAICLDCGEIANHSYRTENDKKLIALGEKNKYKPLCRECFNENLKNETCS